MVNDMRYLIVLLWLPFDAAAEDFPLLPNDEVLNRAEVVGLTERHLIEFYEGGQSRYSVGGSYSYTYQGGGTAYGAFEEGQDGVNCIAIRTGRDRCDRYVRSQGRIVKLARCQSRPSDEQPQSPYPATLQRKWQNASPMRNEKRISCPVQRHP